MTAQVESAPPVDLTSLLTVADYERAAEERLPPAVRAYLATGSGLDRAIAANLEAYARWRLLPRALVDVSKATSATTVLGIDVELPVLLAPTASHRLFHPEGEVATARAAAAAGTIMCVSAAGTTTLSDVAAAAAGAPLWLQLAPYKDKGLMQALIDRAGDLGFRAVVLTVDTPAVSRRLTAQRGGHVSAEMTLLRDVLGSRAGALPVGSFMGLDPGMTWDHLQRLIGDSPLPVIPKGVIVAADVERACDAGAAAIIVSNHGGRQLDDCHATLDALPRAVRAAAGRVEVLVDGGIRSGGDVVKALALGARAVLIGRPYVYALSVGGSEAIGALLRLLRDDVLNNLMLMGCSAPHQLGREHIATVAEMHAVVSQVERGT